MRRTVCGWWCGTKQQTSKQAVARGVRWHSSAVVRGLPSCMGAVGCGPRFDEWWFVAMSASGRVNWALLCELTL